LAVLAPAAIGVPILVGVGPQTRDAALPLLFTVLPYGIAWTLIGLRMTLRGSQTVVDSPNETGPAAEVPPVATGASREGGPYLPAVCESSRGPVTSIPTNPACAAARYPARALRPRALPTMP
jgi:hypothetical protein